jgi:LPS-assembly protein
MVSRSYLWPIISVVVFSVSSASAGPSSALQDSDLPYHLEADSLRYDDATRTYQARGHVTITRGDQSLEADAVDLNDQTREANAWGRVRFLSGKDWLTGDRIQIDLDGGTGTVYHGTLFIEESHFYVRGDEIHKTGEDSYYVRDGRFTTCDGASPAWEITGKDLRLTAEGYGTAKHLALRARSIPVLYAPFLVFPAKRKRQSGLLMPQIGDSNRNGFEYNQPFFWAIGESSDATFYEHYMADRGLKHGLEYRYVLAPESKGAAMFDFLYDRQIDDGTSGFKGFRGDDEDRLNRKRWWFRTKNDQELPAGFKAKLDLDVVSDQDYLREFQPGYTGYDRTDHYFLKEFGRELDDRTETVRLNQLNVNRIWEQYSLDAGLRWYDNVIARINNDPDMTLQTLPYVQFEGAKQPVYETPLYFDLQASYDYFWRDAGTTGHRADMHPRVYYPLTLGNYLDFEPSVGMRETLWQVENYEDEDPTGKDHFDARTLFDFKADLSTELSRVFDVTGHTLDKIKHAVRPQVIYEYVPVPNQEDYPYFEGIDRIEEKNLVTYSITNNFTAKMHKQPKPAEEDLGSQPEAPSLSPKYDYYDFCRVKFTQSYDIMEARRSTDESGKRRPFSDILGEVEFKASRYVGLDGDVLWSPYDGEFKGYNALLALGNDRGDSALVDYRYTQDSIRSVSTRVNVKLLDPFSTYWQYERDLEEGQDIELVVGFKYEPQCWSFNVSYTHDWTIDSQEFFVEISLHGLGKIGL